MSEFDQVLNLGLIQSQGHTRQYLPNRINANRYVLVLAVLGHVVVDDFLRDGLDLLRRHQFVARLDYHGEDLANLVFLVRVQIAQNVRVELQDEQIVSADETRDEPKHEKFDLVLVI
mgnify:CR=1 FL=1